MPLDDQNERWRTMVDGGRRVRLRESQLEDVDENFWRPFAGYESVSCSTGSGGREVRPTSQRHAVLSGPQHEHGVYACTVITERCVAESEAPGRHGTRHDPRLNVGIRFLAPNAPGARHTTALLPPRVPPR